MSRWSPALGAAGHEVVGLDVGSYDDCDFVRRPDECPRPDVDLRDVAAADLEGFDAVIHLAPCQTTRWATSTRARVRHQPARLGRLASAAQAGGLERFLFSSSCSLYGAGGDEVVTRSRRSTP